MGNPNKKVQASSTQKIEQKKLSSDLVVIQTENQEQNATFTEVEEIKNATVQEREKKTLSIKDIIDKNQNQLKRIEQLNKLNETHKNLDSFKLGSDKLRDSLSIEDGEGNDFTTHNSEIISKVVEMIKAEITEKVLFVEKEIALTEAA